MVRGREGEMVSDLAGGKWHAPFRDLPAPKYLWSRTMDVLGLLWSGNYACRPLPMLLQQEHGFRHLSTVVKLRSCITVAEVSHGEFLPASRFVAKFFMSMMKYFYEK